VFNCSYCQKTAQVITSVKMASKGAQNIYLRPRRTLGVESPTSLTAYYSTHKETTITEHKTKPTKTKHSLSSGHEIDWAYTLEDNNSDPLSSM